jgi:hypothetical protein
MKPKRRLVLAILIGWGALAWNGPRPAQPQEPAPDKTEREVRAVFDGWAAALTRGDKRTYLNAFWNSPRLVIRVANGEWRGLDAYRKRIETAQLPPGSAVDYRRVEVVPLGRDAAVVTYERLAPGMAASERLVFVGTLVFGRIGSEWKIAAWHAHAVEAR